MWGAIKNDLYEFVTTIQEDTQQTLSKVIDLDPSFSRTEEEEDKISEEERKLSEFRNDFATYAEDVDAENMPEFQKFLKTFSLSSKAEEIEYILEQESGITKHYEALVPDQLNPDLFWARYFFKVNVLILSSLDSALESAYEEEEELTWGDDDDNDNCIDGQNVTKADSEYSREETRIPAKKESSDIQCQHDSSDNVMGFTAEDFSLLQNNNARLSSRITMLEGEIEKLQNQLINERTKVTKLSTNLNAAEERETALLKQVDGLQLKLEAIENKQNTKSNILSEKAPLSSGSSIVDLSKECYKEHPPSSNLSVASLQSVSSVSTNSTPTSTSEPLQSNSKIQNCKDNEEIVNEGARVDQRTDFHDEEEEWDNEAWD